MMVWKHTYHQHPQANQQQTICTEYLLHSFSVGHKNTKKSPKKQKAVDTEHAHRLSIELPTHLNNSKYTRVNENPNQYFLCFPPANPTFSEAEP